MISTSTQTAAMGAALASIRADDELGAGENTTLRADRRRQRGMLVVALGLALATFYAAFPGQLVPDSIYQYQQALSGNYGDLHPPVMAWLWSWLHLVWAGSGPMLVLQVGLYWLGFGVTASTLAACGRPKAGWCVIALGVLPYFLLLTTYIIKDTGLTVAYLTCFAVAFSCRAQQRALPPSLQCVCWLFLIYGTLVRHNAVFAFGPLALYLVAPSVLLRPVRLTVVSVVLALLARPVSTFVDQTLIGAEPNGSIRLLQVYDLVGTAYASGDVTVLGAGSETDLAAVTRCYTPYFGDSLMSWGSCSTFWDHLGVIPAVRENPFDMRYRNPALSSLWLRGILDHPLAYAAHRLLVLNSAFTFLVPTAQYEFGLATIPIDLSAAAIVWLVIGLCSVMVLFTWFAAVTVNGQQRQAASALLFSGGFYLLGYIPVGIGTSIRYQYWSAVAIAVAAVLLWPAIAQHYRKRTPLIIAWSAVFVGVIALSLWARLSHEYRLFLPTMTGLQLDLAACLQNGGPLQDCLARTYFK